MDPYREAATNVPPCPIEKRNYFEPDERFKALILSCSLVDKLDRTYFIADMLVLDASRPEDVDKKRSWVQRVIPFCSEYWINTFYAAAFGDLSLGALSLTTKFEKGESVVGREVMVVTKEIVTKTGRPFTSHAFSPASMWTTKVLPGGEVVRTRTTVRYNNDYNSPNYGLPYTETDTVVEKPKSTICPCGITRTDCEYRK